MTKFLILFLCLLPIAGCDDRSALFADDFESYAIGSVPSSPWSKSGDGAVAVDDMRYRSGRKSVRFVTGEGYRNRGFIGIFDKNILRFEKNRYYGQMFMWVENASPDGVHWTMIQSSGKVPGNVFSAQIRYGGQHSKRLMANYETMGAKSDCWQHSKIEIPEKRWFKVEWFFDGRRNLMKLWLDDRAVGDLTAKDKGEGCVSNDLGGKWLFPVFENVEIGWVDYQTGGGQRNLWIDDFRISTKPFTD